MKRNAIEYLEAWRNRSDRKPIVIRGARQVGKTFLVRQFAQGNFDDLVEVDFENEADVAAYFGKAEVGATVKLLEAHYGRSIRPGKTLLFLDEIQAAPDVLARLRYFHEQLPDLHVVATGSLLEFVLEDHDFSMPVGRIEYMHLGPLTFTEFLDAAGDHGLVDFMKAYAPGEEFPVGIHRRLVARLREFLVVGGMPESMRNYIDTGDHLASDRARQGILQTFTDDFAKYGAKINRRHLLAAFQALPRLIGQKLKYVNISRDIRAADLDRALHMLELARLCYRVRHAAAQGLPLGAQVNPKVFKSLSLDIGLVLGALGLNAADLETVDLMLANSGAVCEQFVGQHLLYRQQMFRQPELHYWVRERPTSSAEVDYLIGVGSHVVPIEVKAGKTGTLRSLHQFMKTHESPLAVRFNLDLPSFVQVEGTLPTGQKYSYPLLSLPVYLIEQTDALAASVIARSSH
ncbi:MAG: AAA family ATPase [Verrucomicrobiota bacterium]